MPGVFQLRNHFLYGTVLGRFQRDMPDCDFFNSKNIVPSGVQDISGLVQSTADVGTTIIARHNRPDERRKHRSFRLIRGGFAPPP